MSYTQSHLDALKAALATGELLVTYEHRTVRYRNIDELKKAIQIVGDSLAAEAGTPRYTRSYASFSRG